MVLYHMQLQILGRLGRLIQTNYGFRCTSLHCWTDRIFSIAARILWHIVFLQWIVVSLNGPSGKCCGKLLNKKQPKIGTPSCRFQGGRLSSTWRSDARLRAENRSGEVWPIRPRALTSTRHRATCEKNLNFFCVTICFNCNLFK